MTDIIDTLNEFLKDNNKPYEFSTPMFMGYVDKEVHIQINFRVNDKRDSSYYDVICIRKVYKTPTSHIDIRDVWKTFEHELHLHLLFNNPTSTLTDLKGNSIKTFRDIIKIIMNNEIIPKF